jgi:hypothetical protein
MAPEIVETSEFPNLAPGEPQDVARYVRMLSGSTR